MLIGLLMYNYNCASLATRHGAYLAKDKLNGPPSSGQPHAALFNGNEKTWWLFKTDRESCSDKCTGIRVQPLLNDCGAIFVKTFNIRHGSDYRRVSLQVGKCKEAATRLVQNNRALWL
jgi:hypothetical protein